MRIKNRNEKNVTSFFLSPPSALIALPAWQELKFA